MTDETSPRSVSHPEPAAQDGDISLLRKEVIEARNLVIKTDNLLKNLHAELKQMGRKHEEQEKRHWNDQRHRLHRLRGDRRSGRHRLPPTPRSAPPAATRSQRGPRGRAAKGCREDQGQRAARRETSEKALRVYDLLGSEKEGPGLNQAMTQAMPSIATSSPPWRRRPSTTAPRE